MRLIPLAALSLFLISNTVVMLYSERNWFMLLMFFFITAGVSSYIIDKNKETKNGTSESSSTERPIELP